MEDTMKPKWIVKHGEGEDVLIFGIRIDETGPLCCGPTKFKEEMEEFLKILEPSPGVFEIWEIEDPNGCRVKVYADVKKEHGRITIGEVDSALTRFHPDELLVRKVHRFGRLCR